MSKEQFWALNIVGGVCALLMLINLILGRINEQYNQTLLLTQQQLNHAQQMQTAIQNLAGRIAQAGQADPALQALLKRQGWRITPSDAEAATRPRP